MTRVGWTAAQVSDAATGASLAFVGGFVDSAGFLALAGLLPAHVTANFVFVSDELVSRSTASIAKLAALPMFVFAVGAARLVALALERRGVAPMRPLLLLEALILLAVLTAGELTSALRLPAASWLFVAMSAVAAMGVQNAIGRLVIAHLATTTVMTVNVSQKTIDAIDLWRKAPGQESEAARVRLRRIVPAVAAFAIGALAGAYGTAVWSFAAMAVPIVVILGLVAFPSARPLAIA